MDAPTKSRPSVKFSRFHSSQQCDERKAVCTAIIANFSALWQMNLRMSHFPQFAIITDTLNKGGQGFGRPRLPNTGHYA